MARLFFARSAAVFLTAGFLLLAVGLAGLAPKPLEWLRGGPDPAPPDAIAESGEDAIQALLLAIEFAYTLLTPHVRASGRLLFPGTRDEYPLDVIFGKDRS